MRRTDFISRSLFLTLVSLPVVCGLIYSFLYSICAIGFLNNSISFEPWKQVLTGLFFWKSLLFSFYIGLTSVLLSIIFAIAVSVRWRKQLQRGPLATAIYLPLCFPATVMAFYCYQLLSQSGLLSRIFYKVGFTDSIAQFPQLINDGYGIGIIIAMFLLISPFFIILYTQLYRAENLENLSALASSLGASKTQVARKVIIPVLVNRSAVSVMLFVLFVMGNYEVPLLLGRQDPQMISVAVMYKFSRFNLLDIPQGYAMSVLYVVLVVAALAFSYWRKPEFFKPQKK